MEQPVLFCAKLRKYQVNRIKKVDKQQVLTRLNLWLLLSKDFSPFYRYNKSFHEWFLFSAYRVNA